MQLYDILYGDRLIVVAVSLDRAAAITGLNLSEIEWGVEEFGAVVTDEFQVVPFAGPDFVEVAR